MSSPIEQRMAPVKKGMEAIHERARKDRRVWVSKFMPLAAEMLSLSMYGVVDLKAHFEGMKAHFAKSAPGSSAEAFHKALLEFGEMTARYRADPSYLNRIRLKNLGIMGKKGG